MNEIKQLQKKCGTYATARMLMKRGYPIEIAVFLLARKPR